jgi:Predicted transcriptional regulator with C-terminal CBS domains
MENTSILAIFAKNLKERRKKLGLTQAQLASKIGVSTSFITEIELAKKAPSFQTLEKLAEEINVPVWTFFCDYGDQISTDESEKNSIKKQILKEEIYKLIDTVI